MRHLLAIIALVTISTFASGQVQYLGSPTTTVRNRGNFVSDSLFYLPKRQKLPSDTGAIRYAIADSSVYVWSGSQWTKLGASIDTLLLSTRAWRQKGIDSLVNVSILGSGTNGTFPIFTGTNTIGNSTWSSTTAGSNRFMTPSDSLQGIYFRRTGDNSISMWILPQRTDGNNELAIRNFGGSESGIFLGNGRLRLSGGSAEHMRIFANGRIGVNTTTDAGYQFDVNGTARTGTLTVNTNGQARTISTNQASGTNGNNIFIGGAGGTLTGTTGNQSSFNTTVGIEAGNTITTAENSIAVGYRALRDMTTSSFNTSIGNNSQRLNTTGSSNTTLGAGTLESNLTGIQNTAIGRGALAASTASNSTAVGFDALRASTTGINEAFGATALQSVTTGSANAAFGRGALFNVVTTNNNTALGNGAGQLTSGSYANANPINSTYLGTNARPADSAQTNQIVIGHNTIGNGSNTVTIGNSSITQNYFTGEMLVGYTSDQGAFSLQANGNALINGNIRTAAPAGGTANDWRLGTVATVTPTSPNRTIEVSIGGTIYYIHAKTTND